MKKINAAVIGFGMSGREYHLPMLTKNEHFNVLKAMTRNKVNQNDLKKDYPSVEIVTDFDDVLNDEKIDLIVLATSNDVHYEYTKQALLKKKHVICEKPFVETYKEAKELFDLARKQGVMLKVFHNRKYDGDIITTKEIIASNKLGKLVSFTTRFDRLRPEIGENWRFKKTKMAGIFYDLAPHLVHHVIDLFGYPKKVSCNITFDRSNSIVDDHFEMALYYEDGFIATLGAEMLEREPLARIKVVGEDRTYVKYGYDYPDSINEKPSKLYQEGSLRSVLIDNNLKEEKVPLLLGKHYTYYENFYNEVNSNLESPDTNLALMVILIMEKAFESNKENQIITLPNLFK